MLFDKLEQIKGRDDLPKEVKEIITQIYHHLYDNFCYNQQHLRSILDLSNIGYICAVFEDRQPGRIIEVNDYVLEMLKISKKEFLIGMDIRRIFFDKKDSNKFLRLVEKQKIVKDFITKIRGFSKEDSFFVVNISCQLIELDYLKRKDLHIIVQSKEDYYKIVKLLEDERKTFEGIIKLLPIGIIIIDRLYNIIFMNEAMCRTINYEWSQVYNKSISILFPESSKFIKFKRMLSNSRKSGMLEIETSLTRRDNRTIDISMRITPIDLSDPSLGFIIAIFDITKKKRLINQLKKSTKKLKRTEKLLKKSESRYRTLFEESPVPLWEEDFSEFKRFIDQLKVEHNLSSFEDIHQYFSENPKELIKCTKLIKVIDVNNACLKLYKTNNKKEMLGPLYKFVLPEGDISSLRKELSLLASGKTSYSAELINTDLKGNKINILLAINIPEEYKDSLSRVLVSTIDQTELKELEKRRKIFIETTSHELRTPMTSIKGFIEVLHSKGDMMSKEQKERIYSFINRNINRLISLINDVSYISKFERKGKLDLDFELVDFIGFVREKVSEYKYLFGDQFEEKIIVSPNEQFIVRMDRNSISQVLDNVIDNARKHTDNKTRKILFMMFQSETKRQVIIKIKDNGAGIDPENLPKIFDQFYSVSSKYSSRGSGIGLYIAKINVVAHGGTITAYSEGIGKGAEFTIILPLLSQNNEQLTDYC